MLRPVRLSGPQNPNTTHQQANPSSHIASQPIKSAEPTCARQSQVMPMSLLVMRKIPPQNTAMSVTRFGITLFAAALLPLAAQEIADLPVKRVVLYKNG